MDKICQVPGAGALVANQENTANSRAETFPAAAALQALFA
jgi:hypothetical protein